MDDFRTLYTDEEARFYPEIAAAELMSLTTVLHDYVTRGIPTEKKDRMRWLNITATLASLTELHAIPVYRWVSQHVDDCEDCRE